MAASETSARRPRCLDAALEYEKQGFSVVLLHGIDDDGRCTCGKPDCSSPGKHPIGSWKEHQTARQTPEQLTAAFNAHPLANVGVVTGEISGLLVVDVDGLEGFDSLCKLVGNKPPDLPTVKTGKGYHFYGRHPGGKYKNFVKIHPGLDGRGDGGYVAAPPSRHVSGHDYKWTNPVGGPLPELPSVFLDLFTSADGQSEQPRARRTANDGGNEDAAGAPPPPYTGRAPTSLKQYAAEQLQDQCNYVAEAPVGQQERTLTTAALRIGNFVGAGLLDFSVARDALVEAGLQMRNAPGKARWTRAEIAKKVDDKLRIGMKSPKWGADPRGEEDDKSPPIDIFGDTELSEPPTFPTETLPEVLKAFVADRAERLGVEPALIAMPVLAVCAAALDDRVVIQVRRHDQQFVESARLWVAVVEEPGGKKTPAINAAVAPLRQIEWTWRDQDLFAKAKYDADMKVYNEQLKQQSKAKCPPSEELSPEELFSDSGPPVRPPERRLVVTDVTTEKLARILAENPAGVIGVFDELAHLLGSFDAYRGGKGSGRDRAAWLQLYNGGPLAIDRISSGSLYVPNWSASIVGGIQPDRMRKMSKDLGEDGFLQRFIPVFGTGASMGVDKPADETADRGYHDLLRAMTQRQQAKIALSAGAHDVRERLMSRIYALIAQQTTAGALKNHLSKWEALFARLLLTVHSVASISSTGSIEETVDVGTARQVETLMIDYLLPNAMRFYAEFYGRDDHLQHACWVAGHILAHRLPVISARDVGRAYSALRDDPAALERSMSLLDGAGWIVPWETKPGKRPSRWWIDPRVHRVFAERGEQEAARRAAETEKIRRMAEATKPFADDDAASPARSPVRDDHELEQDDVSASEADDHEGCTESDDGAMTFEELLETLRDPTARTCQTPGEDDGSASEADERDSKGEPDDKEMTFEDELAALLKE